MSSETLSAQDLQKIMDQLIRFKPEPRTMQDWINTTLEGRHWLRVYNVAERQKRQLARRAERKQNTERKSERKRDSDGEDGGNSDSSTFDQSVSY